jgi:UDP-2-acetamido-3-amino-2,3-dideoxy-glucuronate N-acetyltransferase
VSVTNYIDSTAIIGANVNVWHFAVVQAFARICDGVSIGSGAEIGKHSYIGNGSRIGAHAFLPAHTRIGENVFVGPNVTCTDDKHPVANNRNYKAQPPTIEDNAAIGAGAVILPGVHVGKGAMIGAGAIVTKNVAPNAIVRCEPANQRGFVT